MFLLNKGRDKTRASPTVEIEAVDGGSKSGLALRQGRLRAAKATAALAFSGGRR